MKPVPVVETPEMTGVNPSFFSFTLLYYI